MVHEGAIAGSCALTQILTEAGEKAAGEGLTKEKARARVQVRMAPGHCSSGMTHKLSSCLLRCWLRPTVIGTSRPTTRPRGGRGRPTPGRSSARRGPRSPCGRTSCCVPRPALLPWRSSRVAATSTATCGAWRAWCHESPSDLDARFLAREDLAGHCMGSLGIEGRTDPCGTSGASPFISPRPGLPPQVPRGRAARHPGQGRPPPCGQLARLRPPSYGVLARPGSG